PPFSMPAYVAILPAGIMIEHNLDVIRQADYIIDLGPERGHAGGEVVIAGLPAHLMAHPECWYTARFLTLSALATKTLRKALVSLASMTIPSCARHNSMCCNFASNLVLPLLAQSIALKT